MPSGLNATLVHRVGVAGQRVADGLAGGRVPQPHRVVVAAGGDARAVGAERHAVHRARCGRSAAAPTGWPVAASHSRTVLSSLPEASRLPSGLNATLITASGVPGRAAGRRAGRCPRPTPAPSCRRCRRRCAVPSGLNATLYTVLGVAGERLADRAGRWPRPTPAPSRRRCRRRCGVPSGLNATLDTASVWPVSGWPTGWPVARVPQPHRLVATAGGDPRAVGAERHAVHRVRCGRSAAAPTGWPVARVPQPHRACRHCRRRCACRRG